MRCDSGAKVSEAGRRRGDEVVPLAECELGGSAATRKGEPFVSRGETWDVCVSRGRV